MSRPFKWNWNLRLQLLLFLQFGWLLQRACLSAEYNSCQSLRLSSFWLIETFPSGSFNRFCWLARKVNSFSTLRTPLCGHANENAWELSSSEQSSSGCSAAFGGSVVSFSLLTAGSTWQRGAAGPISDVTVFQPLLWTPPPPSTLLLQHLSRPAALVIICDVSPVCLSPRLPCPPRRISGRRGGQQRGAGRRDEEGADW